MKEALQRCLTIIGILGFFVPFIGVISGDITTIFICLFWTAGSWIWAINIIVKGNSDGKKQEAISSSCFDFSNGITLIKRNPAILLTVAPVEVDTYSYKQDTPHLRTIILPNVATTEYVDNSGWRTTGKKNTGRGRVSLFHNKKSYVICDLGLSDELYAQALKDNMPCLINDGKYKYFHLASNEASESFSNANENNYNQYIGSRNRLVNSLPYYDDAVKIVDWIKCKSLIDEEEIQEKAKENQIKQKEQEAKKAKIKKILPFIYIIVFAVVAFLLINSFVIKPNQIKKERAKKYEQATILVENHDYLNAIAILEELNENKEYNDKILEIRISYVDMLVASEDYKEAYKYLNSDELKSHKNKIIWNIIDKGIEEENFEEMSIFLDNLKEISNVGEDEIYKILLCFYEADNNHQGKYYNQLMTNGWLYLHSSSFTKYTDEVKKFYLRGWTDFFVRRGDYVSESNEHYKFVKELWDFRELGKNEVDDLFKDKTIRFRGEDIVFNADGTCSENDKVRSWYTKDGTLYLEESNNKAGMYHDYKVYEGPNDSYLIDDILMYLISVK